MSSRPALLVLDLINEITHPDGAYPEVCLAQLTERGVLGRAAAAIDRARARDVPVIYVVLGFAPGYPDWPANSPLFSEVRSREALVLGTWSTQVHDDLEPAATEPVVVKRRVSPFLGTQLDLLLREQAVDTLLLVGATTDLVVLSTAREAHDRGYRVEVLADATATSTQDLHAAALTLISRTARVTTVDEALPR
jgi:nicotinamidase-related amidase